MAISPHLIRADADLVRATKGIKVLGPLSWPADVRERFLAGWQHGARKLPDVCYARAEYGETRAALADIISRLGTSDEPLITYLRDTARSYQKICVLLENAGEPRVVTEISVALYGKPGDSLSGGTVNNIDAARHFLYVAREYDDQAHLKEADYCIPAAVVQAELLKRIPQVIDGHKIAVDIEPALASKAAAGATRIRLRGGTCFSEFDIEQLLQHEAFVHSLTSLNGRCQPNLTALSLPAPRTTGAQEGLATFAELVTGAIDIDRLSRIALRILAIDAALSGADFVEVFEFFLEHGQSELEGFNSSMRVFRGAPLTGGDAFTKDAVYLHGLMEVHTFFRWALQHQRLKMCHWFVAGRMTIADVIRLAPLFEDGTLSAPRYLPPWLGRANGLTAYLAFSVFANQIRIDALDAGSRFDRIEDVGI